jgi:gamma-glutamyltranspeptidase/glutathione hydrolase
MMVPTLGFRDGELRMVAGAPGGTKIVTGVLQTVLNVIDHGLPPLEAVAAPRVDYQGFGDVQVEHRVPEDVIRAMRAAGYPVNRRAMSYDGYFSRVQLLYRDGEWSGASDPRGDGGTPLLA